MGGGLISIYGSYGKKQIGRTLFVNACLWIEGYDRWSLTSTDVVAR
jgi:hypothetical protein